jgi:hypothetical protein
MTENEKLTIFLLKGEKIQSTYQNVGILTKGDHITSGFFFITNFRILFHSKELGEIKLIQQLSRVQFIKLI